MKRGTAHKLKRVVLPPKATKCFEEILKDGGTITSITVHYSLPTEPGFESGGQSFLFGSEVKGIEIRKLTSKVSRGGHKPA